MPPQVAAPLIANCSVAERLTTLGDVWGPFEPRRAIPIALVGIVGLPV
jgi:hypothetical protein